MAYRNKNKAGYIGFDRNADPFRGSGIWTLHMQHNEAVYNNWYNQNYYENTGSLTGWTNNGATISASGNPGNAISVTSTNYCTINPNTSLTNLLYKTIEFDVKVTNGMLAVFFGHNASTGRGPLIKLDARGGGYHSGLMFANSWGSYTAEPISGPQLIANTWYKVQISINNSMRATWYIDNVYRDIQPVLFNGQNIAIHGFGGGGLVDNLKVYNGIW